MLKVYFIKVSFFRSGFKIGGPSAGNTKAKYKKVNLFSRIKKPN